MGGYSFEDIEKYDKKVVLKEVIGIDHTTMINVDDKLIDYNLVKMKERFISPEASSLSQTADNQTHGNLNSRDHLLKFKTFFIILVLLVVTPPNGAFVHAQVIPPSSPIQIQSGTTVRQSPPPTPTNQILPPFLPPPTPYPQPPPPPPPPVEWPEIWSDDESFEASAAENETEATIDVSMVAQRSEIRLGENTILPAMLQLKTQGGYRTGADIICVIDVSGSMMG